VRPLEILVTGYGARGHLGLGALQVAMNARARQLEPRGTRFVDTRGQEAALALAAWLPAEMPLVERMVELAAGALREAAGPEPKPAPLWLALPDEGRPDLEGARATGFLERVAARAALPIDLARSRVSWRGHTGVAVALAEASDALRPGEGPIYVVGVDSPASQATVLHLDERGQFCRDDSEKGRVATEAAAALTITKRARARRDLGLAAVRAVELEEATSPRGASLARLIRRMAPLVPSRPAWLLPDGNGEDERAKGWGLAYTAAQDALDELEVDDFISLTGDTGAATGALLSVLAIVYAKTGAARVRSALLCQESDALDTAGILLDLPEPNGPFRASVAAAEDHLVATSRRSESEPSGAERAQLERVARSCLEDVGSMGLLLAPEPVEGVANPEAFGQRLLDAYDALAALGTPCPGVAHHPDVPGLVERYLGEVLPPDPARRFAASFVRAHLRADPRGRGPRPRRAR